MKPGGRIAPGAGGGLDAVKYRSSVCFPYINRATGGLFPLHKRRNGRPFTGSLGFELSRCPSGG